MNFCSDNVAGIAPEILEAIARANAGTMPSYGGDEITARVEKRLGEIFEREVWAFPVTTGTAANALALSTLTPPYGAVYCHPEAHIMVDECGAPELYTGGAKLVPIAGAGGKISARDVAETLDNARAGDVHHVQPAAVSLTQASECGTAYTVAEVGAIAAVTKKHGVKLHMDGARFANAVAHLNVTPADITWKAGVDVLSFGATKNGALAAEAVVFFDKELAASFGFRRKRAGHLISKMRFISAQLDAYLTNDLWLRLARHANAMAQKLVGGLQSVPGVHLLYPVEANEIFIRLPLQTLAGLRQAGFQFYDWPGAAPGTIRLVTSFATSAADVDAFIAKANTLAKAA
ncbi:threonine aldolase family protein [Dongia rigui]|uniref:L-threonine aldolase n=1 Tax=Dongia rigui TaxID=940149 RepID=A0ABU5DSI3_9PROT|nr:low specificity L-threonine aldolase [Dongia rigui]MDY0870360.1 low specificity L-threonine aldolase [Dongia rigui]